MDSAPLNWRCCLPTSDATTVSLSCPLEPGRPWLVGRALDILRQEAGVESDPEGERYAVGRRRGAPLILGEPLLWNGQAVVAEAHEPAAGGRGEFTLRLPPWSEMAGAIAEDELWLVTDRLALEFDASCGVLSDGRAIGYPDLSDPGHTVRHLQRQHLGVLLPDAWLQFLRPGSTAYRALPLSRLTVVLE